MTDFLSPDSEELTLPSVPSEEATSTKDTAEVVKVALDETERAQNVAKDAIELAQNNTRGTLDLLISVSCFLVRLLPSK